MMAKRPAASIVLPLLTQHNEWLRQCLLSALNQTVRCEVVVVTSPDTPYSNLKMLEALQIQYGGFIVLTRKPNQRFAQALNLGFRRASCGRVGILLSDDWLAPTAVEECLKHEADIVSTGTVIFCEDAVRSPIYAVRTDLKYDQLGTLEEKASYLEHFFLFNKSKLLDVGGVDESIGRTAVDDYDLIWTLLENDATVVLVEQCLYHMRDHGRQRLTLRGAGDRRREFGAILDKHGVVGTERDRLLDEHGRWFGRRIFDVIDDPAPVIRSGYPRQFRVVDNTLNHDTGRLEGNHIVCVPGRDAIGHCLYGPYLEIHSPARLQVKYMVEMENSVNSDSPLITLDVYDSHRDQILHDFVIDQARLETEGSYCLAFNAQADQCLEFRVYWHGNNTIRVSGVWLEERESKNDETEIAARQVTAGST